MVKRYVPHPEYEGDDPEMLNDPEKEYPIIAHDPRGARKGWVVEQWRDENGDLIQRFESGIIRNWSNGHMMKAPDFSPMTKDTYKDIQLMGKEAVQDRIREEVSAVVTRRLYGKEIRSMSAQAVGLVAGKLFEDIVMNENAYPRDRLNAFLAIGRQAGLLRDERYSETPSSDGLTITMGVELARELVERMRNRNEE